MKETYHGYAVKIMRRPNKDRHEHSWFASAGDGTRFFARKRKDATAFKDELQKHLGSKCTVVKAVLTIELEAAE